MIELLKMCGFEADDLEADLPRIEKVFNKLGITAQDIERGKQRLDKYYDIELKGVQKIIRLLIKDIVDTVLAREEGKTKVIYGFMVPGFSVFLTALASKFREVHASYLLPQFHVVLGGIFDKMVPVFEAAEGKWLKAGMVAHCGNVKGLVGLLDMGLIPHPDFLVTSGYLCETAPKTVDLLRELYNIPGYCYDTCQDRDLNNYPEDTKRLISMAAKSLRVIIRKIHDELGFEITDEMVQEVLDAREELVNAVARLQELIEASDPLPINANNQILWTHINALTFSIDSTPEAVDAVNTLCQELQGRVNKGLGVAEEGAPRILGILPPHHTDPTQEYVVGELGMAMVSTDFIYGTDDIATPEDPYEKIVWGIVRRSIYNSPARRIPLIIEDCKRLKVDGVLNRYHIGCRSVTGDALLIEAAVNKLGIPTILSERDDFDSRPCNQEQYKGDLEVFKTMLVNKLAD